jgi:CheY-like chemotaxis protein
VITESPIAKLVQRLRWAIFDDNLSEQVHQVSLRMSSSSTTILVIDDNEGWVALLERFLEGYDCQVVGIQANQDSIKQIQDLNPSVIILDIMMPENDGWELLQRLRTQTTTASIPIIVCTVFDDPQLAYSLGASSFLPKPTSREKILEALREWDII